MDFLGRNGGSGDVAQALLQANGVGQLRPFIHNGQAYVTVYNGHGDPRDPKCYTNQLVANATLRREEWQQLDDALLKISRERLGGFDDLINAGLTYNLGNAFGTTVLETQTLGDAFDAELSMDGVRRSNNDQAKFGSVYLPIPIIHVDYDINLRTLEASRKLGNALDTTKAELATRKVNERLEKMLFTNATYSFGGGTIYSYVNHPNRNTYTIPLAWDDASKTGKLIVTDVLAMKQKAIDAKHYGPYMLYVPTGYETKLDEDYADAKGDDTIRDRVLKISGINGIKTIDFLPADTVLLVQMTSDVVRLVRGMGISNVEWKSEGNFMTNYKVMRIDVPQVRADQDGNSGIVHASV